MARWSWDAQEHLKAVDVLHIYILYSMGVQWAYLLHFPLARPCEEKYLDLVG